MLRLVARHVFWDMYSANSGGFRLRRSIMAEDTCSISIEPRSKLRLPSASTRRHEDWLWKSERRSGVWMRVRVDPQVPPTRRTLCTMRKRNATEKGK